MGKIPVRKPRPSLVQDRQGQAGADGGKGFVDLLVAAGGGADTAGGSRGDTAEGAKAAVVAVLFSAGGSGFLHVNISA